MENEERERKNLYFSTRGHYNFFFFFRRYFPRTYTYPLHGCFPVLPVSPFKSLTMRHHRRSLLLRPGVPYNRTKGYNRNPTIE